MQAVKPEAQIGKCLYIWWLKTIVIYKPYTTEFETWMSISYFNILLLKHKYFDSQTAESEVDLAVLRPKLVRNVTEPQIKPDCPAQYSAELDRTNECHTLSWTCSAELLQPIQDSTVSSSIVPHIQTLLPSPLLTSAWRTPALIWL